MKKVYLLSVAIFIVSLANAINYYVDGVNGNNSNNGKSVAQAFKTIPTAAALTNAGDTVFIMNGSYAAFVISRPGNSSGQIVYTNYPGHYPKIISTSTTYIAVAINAGANYVTVNGLEVIGWGVNLSLAADTIPAQAAIVCPAGATSTTNVTFIAKYNGSGINIGGSSVVTHHIVLSNNIVHDCAAAGIGIGYSDYITIDGNTVYNNSWYTPYGTSGISFGNSLNYDNNTTTYRNIIKNNICYGNRLYVLWRGSCTISDGNGIIIDIPKTGYNGKQLVVNNICFNNGGSGIHTINNNHVDFINNTAYLNSASPTNGGSAIYAYACDDVKFYNNILVSRPGKLVNRCPNSTNVIYDYNIYYGGATPTFVGPHSIIQDPKFVNPSTDPAVADFHLQAGSFAVNNGDNSNTTLIDKDGKSRPIAGTVDMGAYESSFTGNLNDCSGTIKTKNLGTGIGTGEGSASTLYGPFDSKPATNNQQSRKAINYPAFLLTGVPANASINSLQFNRAVQISPTNTTASAQTVPDNSTIKIYLRNETSDNFGATAFDWASILPGATNPAVLVYGGDASTITGNSGGWKTIPFQIPFTYTGGNLGVFVEYLQKGSIATGTDINWIYDNGGSQPLYNTTTYPQMVNAFKYAGSSGNTPISNSLTGSNERRPVMNVGYCSTSVLPIALLKFSGEMKDGGALLNWLVGNETNNAGFEVQRSKDGNVFGAIGFVASKADNGNSPTIQHYTFTDLQPINGTSFYRLLQKDKDGRQSYSPIISITSVAKQLELVSIYPNPVGDKLNALVNVSTASPMATISVQDLSGRTVGNVKKQLPMGYSNVELDVSKQVASTYILVIELPSGEKLIRKFIKN